MLRLVFGWRWQPWAKYYLNFGSQSCNSSVKGLPNRKDLHFKNEASPRSVDPWQISFHLLKQKQWFAEVMTNSFHVQQYSWRCLDKVTNFFFIRSTHKINKKYSTRKTTFAIKSGYHTQLEDQDCPATFKTIIVCNLLTKSSLCSLTESPVPAHFLAITMTISYYSCRKADISSSKDSTSVAFWCGR